MQTKATTPARANILKLGWIVMGPQPKAEQDIADREDPLRSLSYKVRYNPAERNVPNAKECEKRQKSDFSHFDLANARSAP
jgi:hypothetical protein